MYRNSNQILNLTLSRKMAVIHTIYHPVNQVANQMTRVVIQGSHRPNASHESVTSQLYSLLNMYYMTGAKQGLLGMADTPHFLDPVPGVTIGTVPPTRFLRNNVRNTLS